MTHNIAIWFATGMLVGVILGGRFVLYMAATGMVDRAKKRKLKYALDLILMSEKEYQESWPAHWARVMDDLRANTGGL